MKLAILFLLATAIHVESPNPYAMVYVKTCSGAWATIYADKRMTIPLANPLVVNRDGSYDFYTPNQCVKIKEVRNPQ
jgi:hypothetical protein